MGNFFLWFRKCSKDSNGESNRSAYEYGSRSKKYTEKEPLVDVPDQQIHENTMLALKATEEFLGGTNDVSIYTADLEGRVNLIRERRGKVIHSWQHHERSISDIDVVNGYIATASRDRTVKLFSPASATLTSLEGHLLGVTACEFSNEHCRMWSGSRDTTVRYWDTEVAKAVRVWETPRNIVQAMRKADNVNQAVQASEDLTLKVWDSRMENPATTISTGPNIPQTVDVRGDYIATGHNGFNGEGCEILVIDQRMGNVLIKLKGHKEAVKSVSFVDSRVLVSGSKDETIKLWSVKKSTPLHTTPEQYGSVFCVSSAGKSVFAGNVKSYLMLYKVNEKQDGLNLKSIL